MQHAQRSGSRAAAHLVHADVALVTEHHLVAILPLWRAADVTHHVPEDQAGAANEAIRQAGIMMEQVKAIREASQAAYDASSALQSNVQVSWSPPVLLGYAI